MDKKALLLSILSTICLVIIIGNIIRWIFFRKIELCTTCNKENKDPAPFYPHECTGCMTKRMIKIQEEQDNEEREQRIREMTEAFRRAFPQGPYR